MPKLLYPPRTSECREGPLLSRFDDTLQRGLTNNSECRPRWRPL